MVGRQDRESAQARGDGKRRQAAWKAALLGAAILACLPPAARAAGGAHDLPPAADLRAEAAQAARAGGPLVVIFSRADCKWCEAVKRDYLKPLAAHPRWRDRVVVRQVEQDGGAALAGFAGEATTHAAFATREKVKLVPVVAFYGPDGRRLAEPIVGARLPDFYQGYLEDAIEQSARNLKSR